MNMANNTKITDILSTIHGVTSSHTVKRKGFLSLLNNLKAEQRTKMNVKPVNLNFQIETAN